MIRLNARSELKRGLALVAVSGLFLLAACGVDDEAQVQGTASSETGDKVAPAASFAPCTPDQLEAAKAHATEHYGNGRFVITSCRTNTTNGNWFWATTGTK